MPITPIALGVRPVELPSAQETMANALNQYAFKKAQREDAVQNAMAQAYAASVTPEGDVDFNALRRNLGAVGAGAAIPGAIKAQQEAESAKLTHEKTKADLVDAKLKQSRAFLDTIDPTDPNAPQQYLAWHESNHADPILGPVLAARGITADQARARIVNAIQQGPEAFANLLNQSKLGTEKFMEMNKPTFREQNLGRITRVLQIPASGGAATVVPGSEAAIASGPRQPTEFEIALSMVPLEQRQAAVQAKLGLSKPNEVAQTITDEAGNVRMFNKQGQEITPTAAVAPGQAPTPVEIKGKPSATFEKTRALRQQQVKDIDLASSQLQEAIKEGGLLDQSTGSGIGRAVDVSAEFFGKATPGSIAIGKLQPIADLVLKQIPRFEGPQSDKDTQTYKEAAGQLAKASLPVAIRKEAARTILEIMKRRKEQFVSTEMAAEGLPAGRAAPAGGADIDALLNKYK